MSGTGNKITLTIAGDATGVEKALARTVAAARRSGDAVSRSSKDMTDSLHETKQSAIGAASALDGTMYAIRGLGVAVPPATQNLYSLALGASQLSHGAGELLPKLETMIADMSSLKFTAGLLAGTLGGMFIAWQVGTAAGNKLNDVLGRTPSLAQSTADAVRRATAEVVGYATALGYANAAQSALLQTKALTTMQFHAQSSPGAGDWMQGPVPLDATGHLLNSTNGGDTYAKAQKDAANAAAAVAKAKAAALSGARSSSAAAESASAAASRAMDAALQAAKDKLQRWQGIADKFSNVAKGIQDSLGPKLVAGISSPLMLAKGTSLLDGLEKQLKDTLHLKDDLARLSKAGLSNGLLEQLTAGGLDSLGAADELLAGGKSGIHAVNRTAKAINAAGGSIAGADAARQFADSLKKPQVIELKVGKGGDGVLDAWLQKALKTKGAKFYGLKAA